MEEIGKFLTPYPRVLDMDNICAGGKFSAMALEPKKHRYKIVATSADQESFPLRPLPRRFAGSEQSNNAWIVGLL